MAGAQPSVTLLVRVAVSAVFLLSGAIKLLDPARFLIDVQAFGLLPPMLAYATALVLPWLEVLCAVALWSRLAGGAALLLGAATLGFMAAILLASARGTELDCGCFGDWLVFPNLGVHMAFNALLVTGCAWLLWRELRVERATQFSS